MRSLKVALKEVNLAVNVRNMKKPVLYEDVLKVLLQNLGDEYDEGVLSVLAAHVCDEKVGVALEKVLKVLFHHGLTIPQLLSALLDCESLRMQRLFSGHAALPVDKQFDHLEHVIHHFNTIQDEVLKVGKSYLIKGQKPLSQEEESEQLDADRLSHVTADESSRQAILEHSLKHWQQTKKIKLYNFFQGVPVHATVNVLNIDTENVFVQSSTDLIKVFSCQKTGDMAYAVSGDEHDQVAVSIEEAKNGAVQLIFGDVSQSVLNSRKNLGVHMIDEVLVELRVRGKTIHDVALRDISSEGLGFSVAGMTTEPCRIGEVIECGFHLGEKRIDAHGWVRWVVMMNGEVRMGMELRTHIGVQQALQKEVFRIQRQIILALNELEVPKKLAQA